ncbi:MAG: response regulator transcription factor [Christensenellaceae bacterium]|nr:response regulator transcription factor [Christensenellaceae bacterium]
MQAWICDDNAFIVKVYENMVADIARQRGTGADIRTFLSGEELIAYSREHDAPDVLLLDVLMDGLNGMQTAQLLREQGMDAPIVFITSTPDYAIDGYKVKAYRYILKPVQPETLAALLAEIAREGEEDSILLPSGKSNMSLKKSDIVFIERINRKTHIHMQDGSTAESVIRLDELEAQLPPAFARCHKSFIVNLKYCVRLKASEVILRDGITVSISRPNAQKTKAAFFEYHNKTLD